MSASWVVNVGGRFYGPYADAQMAAFAMEGRLAVQSMIARTGENNFRPAGSEPELAALFAPAPLAPAAPAAQIDAPVAEPDPEPALRPNGVFGRNNEDGPKNGEITHIVIVADMKSRSITGLEEEVYKLGQAYSPMPQMWLLKTEQSLNTVRNLLVQQLGKLDVLFVVDATHDKAAWFNFGPEAEARIRRIWTRGADASSKLRAMG